MPFIRVSGQYSRVTIYRVIVTDFILLKFIAGQCVPKYYNLMPELDNHPMETHENEAKHDQNGAQVNHVFILCNCFEANQGNYPIVCAGVETMRHFIA